jgi:tryptophan synthase beta chain
VSEQTKYLLAESDIPTQWVNLTSDLPGTPAPHPATKEPLGPQDLAPIFPMGLIEQEVSADPEIEIPDEVREIYKLWRPTPLHRARRLERARHAGRAGAPTGGAGAHLTVFSSSSACGWAGASA